MHIKKLQEKYSDVFKKMGSISYNLSRIKFYIVSALSTFFMDFSNPHSEKSHILNEALFDENIFPKLENKMQLLIKIIKDLSLVAEEFDVVFDKDVFLKFCKSVGSVKEIRNKVAHKYLMFLPDGKVAYNIKKNHNELVHNLKFGISKKAYKRIDIDLDVELEKSQTILDEASKFNSDFIE